MQMLVSQNFQKDDIIVCIIYLKKQQATNNINGVPLKLEYRLELPQFLSIFSDIVQCRSEQVEMFTKARLFILSY